MKISEIMIREVKTIDIHETVTKALSLMEKEHLNELPALSGGKLKGLITFHSIITYPKYSKNLTVNKLIFKTPELKEDDELITALKYMKEVGVQGLPVTRGDELIGFVSDYDILNLLKNELKGTVNDFMKQLPPVLNEKDNIARAKKLFYYNKVKSLPVVSNNKLIGVLLEEDLLKLFKPHEGMGYSVSGSGDSTKLLNTSIKGVLNKNYETVIAGENIIKVIDLMLKNHLTSIIVIDDENEPIGYLERFELIKHLYNERKPRGVLLEFTGLELDYPTNALLTKVVQDHLNKINNLAKNLSKIKIQIKSLHAGEGIRKFELTVKIILQSGKIHRNTKVGYALRETLDEALTNIERLMKKNYKKNNP